MTTVRPITIIGGGLAGLTLGLALRQREVPVTIWEAGHYPRHRVCGEFICGRGRATLTALGLDAPLLHAGARLARTAAFFADATAGPVRALPEPALCLSRFALDATLAAQFRARGGELHAGKRWTGSLTDEGIIQASGRRARTTPARWRWFGLKAHARGIALTADLEMHLTPGGYIGLCQLADGVVNLCGLFRRRRDATDDALPSRTEMLRGAPGSVLHERLARAEFLPESVCAIGGLDLAPLTTQATDECRIGDALTMIPPFTGNGMSMAFESAQLATEPLAQWSRAENSWPETRRTIAARSEQLFRPRLTWARRLHALMFCRPLQPAIVRCLPRSAWSWNFLFSHTR